jgi:type II secretory pathway component HofQ
MQSPRRLALCACIAWCLALPAAAQVMRIYEVRHRTAEELLPMVETAMSGEGRAAADRRTNTLVLSGSRQAVESALELLAALDVRPRTVVLRYESRGARELSAQGARIAWSVGAGAVRVGNVIWPDGGSRVAVQVDEGELRRSSTLSGTLRILDGRSGRIATGTSLPVATRRVHPGPAGPVFSESTQYVSADSGFEATPRVLGDGRIEVVLRPFEASVSPGGTIAHSGADTVLLLQPGRTVALGGILRDASSDGSSALAGGESGSERDESLLLVSAEIE